MDLLLTEEQQMIVDAIDDVLLNEFPLARLHQPDVSLSDKSWQHMAELGWFGLGLPESAAGVGYGLAEEMLLCRASQKQLLSPSLLGTILAGHLAAASDELSLVEAIIAGSVRVAIAVPRHIESLSSDALTAELYVIGAEGADAVLLWNRDMALLVDSQQIAGSQRQSLNAVDDSLSLELLQLVDAKPQLFVSAAQENIALRASVLLAAMQTGLADAVTGMAVEYAKTREQFGVAIGSFQAIKHACADMACRVEAAQCQTTMAAVMVADATPGSIAQAASARLLAAAAARENVEQNIQIHGAMGFTTECNAHLFLKRCRLLEQIGGTARDYQRDLMQLQKQV